MTAEHLIILILGALFLITNLFWLIAVHRLLNKVMSRNYGDFIAAENLKKPKVLQVQEPDPMETLAESQTAKELNIMMGMV